jgi:hypothetical protein
VINWGEGAAEEAGNLRHELKTDGQVLNFWSNLSGGGDLEEKEDANDSANFFPPALCRLLSKSSRIRLSPLKEASRFSDDMSVDCINKKHMRQEAYLFYSSRKFPAQVCT